MRFDYELGPQVEGLSMEIMTVAHRRIYRDVTLDKSPGFHTYTLNWGSAGVNLSNGFYYFALETTVNGRVEHKVLKVLILR